MSGQMRIGLGVLAVLVIAGGLGWWLDDQLGQEEALELVAEEEARRVERQGAVDERWRHVREESGRAMPRMLEGIELGMRIAEVRAVRSSVTPNRTPGREEPGLAIFEEQLSNGARVVYVFEEASGLLQRVQVLSLLPDVRAIAPHLESMNITYGTPTGVWNCPDTEGVATRRFTWRMADIAIMDVFLIVENRVSLTLYIAPSHVVERSLHRSRCRPAQREDLGVFPTTTRETLEATQPPTP